VLHIPIEVGPISVDDDVSLSLKKNLLHLGQVEKPHIIIDIKK